jgi:hypothetical protein
LRVIQATDAGGTLGGNCVRLGARDGSGRSNG